MKTRNFLWAGLVACWLPVAVQAQVKKAIKYFDKKQYDAAVAACEVDLANPNEQLSATLLLSRIYADTANEKRDLAKAYEYIEQTLTILPKASEKQISVFQSRKYYVNPRKQLETIILTALSEARAAQTSEALDNFLQIYKDLNVMQLQHASESRNAIAWDEARKANTAAAYESFWTRYNESCQRYSPVIHAQAERELFESAMRQSEWADYAIFANKFPNNIYVQDSAAAIKMQIAIFKNSLEGYKKYLQAYPQSPFAKIALDSVFAHIERERPLEELDFFVRNYPQSIHIQAVWKILYQEFCKTESCPNAFYSAYPTAPKPLN